MDPDVRAKVPGKCPRCGMTLRAGIPEPIEIPVRLTTRPRVIKAGAPVELTFNMVDPLLHRPVRDYEIVHEKLFHLFVVSQDLSVFVHTHPQLQPDFSFKLAFAFPKPGLYRLLSDFYPKGRTPQLIASSVIVPGTGWKLEPARLTADLKPQHAENLDIELQMEPPEPIVGQKVLMFFRLRPKDGIEPYIGAMGHMLAVSWDLIDMIHNHPFLADGGPEIQFNMIFPRARTYRVWVQFQRNGVVNTAHFDVPVQDLQ